MEGVENDMQFYPLDLVNLKATPKRVVTEMDSPVVYREYPQFIQARVVNAIRG